MLARLSDDEIALRLNVVEQMILKERDVKSLPALNQMFQRLLDEQVRRDLLHKETGR